MLIPAKDIEEARSRIAQYLPPTPLIFSRHFSERTGCRIFLKLETLQPTHSFKVRGAFNAVLAIPEMKRSAGVITASRGNHGLGVALACATLNVPCTIYLAENTPVIKVEAINKLGAKVIFHGQVWDEANSEAMNVAKKNGSTYVHSFDDPYVMAGQGTIVLELIEQLKNIDMIVTSVAGGGLISGIISAVQHWLPKTRVAGVETDGANCMAASLEAGHIVELPAITSIAESLGIRKTAQRQFEIISHYANGIALVSDQEAIASLIEILSAEKILVEPAASCSIAALTQGKISCQSGETIVVIICGANVPLQQVCEWQREPH